MTDQQRDARLHQIDRELTDTLEDMQAKAKHLHGIHEGSEWPHDLEAYARRIESTRDYLRELWA